MSVNDSIVGLVVGAMILASFFAGKFIGMQAAINTGIDCSKFLDSSNGINVASDEKISPQQKEKVIDLMVNKRIKKELRQLDQIEINQGQENTKQNENKASDKILYKPSANVPIKKLSYVSKEDFLQNYDMGINETISQQVVYKMPETKNILMMHYKKDKGTKEEEIHTLSSSKKATEDCDVMLIIGNRPRSDKNHCLAYFSNYDNYHIHRYVRLGGTKIDSSKPLKHVSRGLQISNLKDEFIAPKQRFIDIHWELLKTYLNNVDSILDKLKPITKSIAKDNTIVIMVCNEGQASLLLNFVCSSKAKGFDISMLFVFATDLETYDAAKGLGIETFYDEAIFGNIPNAHSERYGNLTFTRIMWAKVLCTHITSMLNHNFLFQDVDVVWYRHPLDFFNSENLDLSYHDIYFQPDGSQQIRYSPHFANSGFYYVKSNDKTRYLFTAFIYTGDFLWTTHSHQQVLGQLLAEHSSLFNLHVKILARYNFPGGAEYHTRPEFMGNFILQKVKPWIFHMSWTLNKDNKLKHMKQMGMWYLKSDACENIKSLEGGSNNIALNCCSATPLISCHYKDKSSIIPCHDSPSVEKGKSYWLTNISLKKKAG